MAVQYVLDRDVASGHDIQVPVGHITWVMFLRREALAILSSVYASARMGTEPVRLWDSVRRELCQVADPLPLLVFLFCDTGIGWSEKVMCTDTCDSGFGVLKRTVELETVAKWGRQSERFRYLFEDSVCARRHALR